MMGLIKFIEIAHWAKRPKWYPVSKLCEFCSKILILHFLLVLFCLSCTQPFLRIKTDFNTDWKFYLGDDSLANSPDYDDSHWRVLNLPHDWSIEGEFSLDNPTTPAGGALPAGVGWYRKEFRIDQTDKDMLLFIDFEGIYRNSEMWFNGHYLGNRANGYISFRYDLTSFIHYGEEPNILAVKVDNSLQPNSRWYTGSGIYRNVWLVRTSKIHIDHWGVFITTPKIVEKEALVQITTRLTSERQNIDNIKIRSTIVDHADKELTKAEEFIVIGDSIPIFSQGLYIEDPHLWSPENPNLYKVRVEVFADNIKVDEQFTDFGIRYFRFDTDSGFYLNGERYEIRGMNLHHDLGALGAAVNKRAIERQLEIMKGMGVNAIRTAHNPPAPELLDLCDEMGFLVMVEAFDVWKKKKVQFDYHINWEKNYRQDLKDMVLRDRNHPSVFMWSIGNEIREQLDSTGINITRELVTIVKDLDPTRPVTCALTETDPKKNFIYQSGALDVLGFNYKHEEWVNFKENYPGKKMLASENMSVYATRGYYDMPSDSIRHWPVKFGDPIIGANTDYTVSAYDMICAFWGSTHEETLKAFYKTDFLNSIFIWAGFDFLGEPVPYEWPAKNSYYGIVDLAGFPKDVYYLYQSIWTDTPTLHIFPHWNWEEGQLIDVWVYYNQADEVEVFLNDQSFGTRKKEQDEYHVMWRIPYQPGILKAISRKNGKTVLIKEVRTAGMPAIISLDADRQKIKADGYDLSFITVKILDEDGNLAPRANNLVNFEISGNGFIAGVDNGYQASHEPFKSNHRKAFNGLCLAVIQSDGNAGTITLKATSENLKGTTINLTAQ